MKYIPLNIWWGKSLKVNDSLKGKFSLDMLLNSTNSDMSKCKYLDFHFKLSGLDSLWLLSYLSMPGFQTSFIMSNYYNHLHNRFYHNTQVLCLVSSQKNHVACWETNDFILLLINYFKILFCINVHNFMYNLK